MAEEDEDLYNRDVADYISKYPFLKVRSHNFISNDDVITLAVLLHLPKKKKKKRLSMISTPL